MGEFVTNWTKKLFLVIFLSSQINEALEFSNLP